MRERIINETVLLIQHKGFAFTVEDLARKLGTSKRTIYQHFTSKDQLIEVIIEKLISQIKEKEKEIADNEKIELLDKIKQILCCAPEEFEILDIRLLSDLRKHHFNQWEKLDHFLREEWTVVFKLMEQGIQQGFIRPTNLQIFIALYIGAINQLYRSPMISSNPLTIREKLQEIVDILLHGIVEKK